MFISQRRLSNDVLPDPSGPIDLHDVHIEGAAGAATPPTPPATGAATTGTSKSVAATKGPSAVPKSAADLQAEKERLEKLVAEQEQALAEARAAAEAAESAGGGLGGRSTAWWLCCGAAVAVAAVGVMML